MHQIYCQIGWKIQNQIFLQEKKNRGVKNYNLTSPDQRIVNIIKGGKRGGGTDGR